MSRLQRQDSLIVFFLTKAFNYIPNNKDDKGNQIRFSFVAIVLILICLFLMGSEAVKIILRKRIGKGEISFIRLFLTLMLFTLLGVILLALNTEFSQSMTIQSPLPGALSFTLAGIFYISLAILIVVLGIYNKLEAQKRDDLKRPLPNMYPGNSRFWKSIEKKSRAKRSLVRNLLDPSLFLVCGFAGLSINPFLGLPLIICSISYWIVFLIEFTVGMEKERLDAIREYESYSNNIPNLGLQKNISSILKKW